MPNLDADQWQLGININRALDIILFVDAPTIRRMAAKVCDGSAWRPQTLLQLRPGDASTPLFLFAGGFGDFFESLIIAASAERRGVTAWRRRY